jgi:hypothetical protein
MTGRDEFSVAQFFDDGTWFYVREYVSGDEAMAVFKQCTRSFGAKHGLVRRVLITDGGDEINVEWKYGKGITYAVMG